MDKKILAILLFFSLSIGICGPAFHVSSVKAPESLQFRDNLGEIRVALYNGSGADPQCVLAMTKLFEWMGCNVTTVQAEDIINGYLDNFSVLAWPGGSYPAYWEVGPEGKLKIQDFISGGGGYMGICAGAWWACDYMVWMADPNYPPPEYHVEGNESNLDLFPGVARGPIEEITPFHTGTMTRINIVNHTHPITDSLPDYMQIMYWGGPHLLPYEDADVTILGTYDVTGTPAIVAFEYGDGRVFLCGPHPEFEEDSDRDGVPPLDPEWSDEGSDWPLLLEAMKWLTARSTYDQMQDLTDSLLAQEIQDLYEKLCDLEDKLQNLIELNNQYISLQTEFNNLSAQLSQLEEDYKSLDGQISKIQYPPQVIYVIMGITFVISIIAITLPFIRKKVSPHV